MSGVYFSFRISDTGYLQPISWMSRYVAVTAGPAWVLASIGQSPEMPETPEEVVSTFQGIVCKMDLPPFTEKIR